ncbi:MAG: cache domain-containing protein [Spirochaetales bacterium]|nr:cache domain-containing protein [Spirochaetales bacterium]
MNKRKSLVGSVRLITTIFLIILSLLILTIELTIHRKDHIQTLNSAKEDFYRQEKERMECEVNRIIERFSFQSERVAQSTRNEVKNRTKEGYTIARAIYENGRDNKSTDLLQKEILETLRLLSYRDGLGYYFVIRLDGVTLMNKAAPFVENQDRREDRDREGNYFIKDMVKLAREEGEGHYSYLWFKQNDLESDIEKTSYVKHFEPYDWLIGTGLYAEDIKNDLQKSLLASIEYVYSETINYVFIIDKEEGEILLGQNKGQNLREADAMQRFDDFRKLSEEGGGFLEYPALTPEGVECQQLIHVNEFEEWNWIIGTTVYTDKLETQREEIILHEHIIQRQEILRISVITFLCVLIITLLLNMINRYFLQDISSFSRFFKQAALDDIPLEKELLRYRELADLGEYANQMVEEKKNREEERHKLRTLESLGFLAAGIAHDFNNALMGIFGNIELALMSLDNNDAVQSYLSRAIEAMDNTKSLTGRLLTFSRGGRPDLHPLSLKTLFSPGECYSILRNNIELINNTESSELQILADRTQLLLVLEILFNNCNEAMPDGGSIHINAEKTNLLKSFPSQLSGSFIRLEIKDTGKGMDKETCGKIFDPYFSTKDTGRGLGLPTVYNIMKQHRGHIAVKSEPGEGTTVSLYIPEAPPSLTEADSVYP